MHPTVYPIDDHIVAIGEFIYQSDGEYLTHNRRAAAAALEDG
jgi:hypothetical protein